jgi:hypothetical protein
MERTLGEGNEEGDEEGDEIQIRSRDACRIE